MYSFSLVDDVASHVWHEGCWNLYAVLCLVVLQKCCNYAGKGQSRAVQCVAEFGFLCIAAAVAALQSVGLIGIEVAH